MNESRVLILGAAGRDFHNFNVYFRDNPGYRVMGFTATQIPGIDGRRYPPELAGSRYPQGIPIEREDELPRLIREWKITQVVFAYSDVKHEHVMHLASQTLAAGADFRLLGVEHTMLQASVPVVAVCAVRTGCGKSQTSRYVAARLKAAGKRVVAVRHPMPYGDLTRQVVQRFASYEDLEAHDCTLEEREEYETHLESGTVVYAGVDYAQVLERAQTEADAIIWDGGNNDTPFFRPDLWIAVVDPLRPGHELTYHPGETNLIGAHLVLLNKATVARPEDRATVLGNIATRNPKAVVVQAESRLVFDEEAVRGKRVLVVEDGPTVTHGEMPFGAATVAAQKVGARIMEPRGSAVGSILAAYKSYPHLGLTVPAVGYSDEQLKDLEQTINGADCDAVLYATPIDLGRLLKLRKPAVRVRYELADLEGPTLGDQLDRFLHRMSPR
ncbi:MAG: GTPase [Deltaproteobacteria bacterium]|nr:GTPase [Deltaproteobacteria bacterium]